MLHSLRGAARCRRGAATAARCGLPQQVGRQDVDLPPTARHQPGTFKFRLGGSNGVLKAFDLADQMDCWHAGVPDLALGGADAVESVEEAREVEGRLGAERSSAKSASMSSYGLLQ